MRRLARPPSFTDHLPWVEYLPEARAFLLEDGASVGALFELTPVATEARPPEFLAELRDALQTALSDAIPERDDAPWVVQLYAQDEPSLEALTQTLATYIDPNARGTAFTHHYQHLFATHLARLTCPEGVFEDTAVTGGPWRGHLRRVRATLYRRLPRHAHQRAALEIEAELNDIATRFTAALAAAGVTARRGTGEDFYAWLLPWFNPNPLATTNANTQLPTLAPYPGDDTLPFGADFAESLVLSMPRSEAHTGTWWFDEVPHTVISIQSLRRAPEIGHFTAERLISEHVCALADRLPPGTIMVMTLTVTPQDKIRTHLNAIRRAAVGDSAEASITRDDATHVEHAMAHGDKLYPMAVAFYLRGDDLPALKRHVTQLHALLLSNGQLADIVIGQANFTDFAVSAVPSNLRS